MKSSNIPNIINHVNESIIRAYQEQSKLNNEILNLNGMSTVKVRHLFNNLLEFFNSYLEVGSYEGSTLCSAIYKNNLNNIYAFENFSESFSFGPGSKEKLINNINKYKNSQVSLIEEDFFNNNLNDIKNIEVFFYDGIHRLETQYACFGKIKSSLSNISLVIIDDFYCKVSHPKYASFAGIRDFGYKILYYWELPSGDFHGGLGLFLLEKS